MKFTLNWLKRHLETDASLEEICLKLTAIGLEVEDVQDSAKAFAPFKVALVEKAEKHPDADKLKVCTVRTESGVLQVVCGAPNARTGMKGIFAPAGSYIPGTGVTLKKGVIRGAESCGMLVSEREMGLSTEHEGIIEVDATYEIGTPLTDIYGLGDPVIEINLTPNRADCAGVRGIARDLAAAGLGRLKPLTSNPVKGAFKSPVTVDIADKDGCYQFFGRYIKGVQNGPSPDWLQNFLKATGHRPISALVDITNWMTLDLCRPMHVFDAEKLHGNLHVRETAKGETLAALNDKTYTMPEAAVGVYDDQALVALGGIIGGASTGCADATTDVFLEAALFNPVRLSRTGRDLQISTDARYRLERGVDPAFVAEAMEIATAMILDICGGEASDIVVAGHMPDWRRDIAYDPAYLERLTGIALDEKIQKKILKELGFEIKGKTEWAVTPPPWRSDVEGRADIAEEIARIYGYEHIPVTPVHSETPVPAPAETPMLARARKARAALAAHGMDECITWSFMSRDLAAQFAANDDPAANALILSNPISADLDRMRPSILPNLLQAARGNQDRGFGDCALFEIGPVFQSAKPEGQSTVAAGLRAGQHLERHWASSDAARPNDAFDAKADALAALEACGAPAASAQLMRGAPPYYHAGRSGVLKLGPNTLAYFGEIHPGILEDMGIKGRVAGFEIFLNAMPEARKKTGPERPLLTLPPLQPVRRDYAFIVDQATQAQDLIRAVTSADKNLIREAKIFDVYAGKGVEEGKKSIALAVILQAGEKTLTDKDLEDISANIVTAVRQKTGGVLRG